MTISYSTLIGVAWRGVHCMAWHGMTFGVMHDTLWTGRYPKFGGEYGSG